MPATQAAQATSDLDQSDEAAGDVVPILERRLYQGERTGGRPYGLPRRIR
jgi:hypothetical protein